MASCEKCWNEATRNMMGGCGVVEEYSRLIKINKCTPEEQAGKDATECPICKRLTIHILAGICMVCGLDCSGGHIK